MVAEARKLKMCRRTHSCNSFIAEDMPRQHAYRFMRRKIPDPIRKVRNRDCSPETFWSCGEVRWPSIFNFVPADFEFPDFNSSNLREVV
jgi:hypothetical protein